MNKHAGKLIALGILLMISSFAISLTTPGFPYFMIVLFDLGIVVLVIGLSLRRGTDSRIAVLFENQKRRIAMARDMQENTGNIRFAIILIGAVAIGIIVLFIINRTLGELLWLLKYS